MCLHNSWCAYIYSSIEKSLRCRWAYITHVHRYWTKYIQDCQFVQSAHSISITKSRQRRRRRRLCMCMDIEKKAIKLSVSFQVEIIRDGNLTAKAHTTLARRISCIIQCFTDAASNGHRKRKEKVVVSSGSYFLPTRFCSIRAKRSYITK